MVQRWNKVTEILVHKRVGKVLRLLDWKFRQKFEHVSDEVWESNDHLQ